MLKAGALYFSVVIAFFIAVICASLILMAGHYRNGYLKELRRIRLVNNLESGQARVLVEDVGSGYGSSLIDLYGDGKDSLMLFREAWGAFDLATVKSFISIDTLSSAFLIGLDAKTDSVALYLSDEDRPLALSGDTRITGDVYIPKSGMRKSYAEGRPFTGKEMVNGKPYDSGRKLKAISEQGLTRLFREFERDLSEMPVLPNEDLSVSFMDSIARFRVEPEQILQNKYQGHMALYADTTIVLSAASHLDNVLLFANVIVVEKGFKGNCQLFVRDSILVKEGSLLRYPSVIGLLAGEKLVGQGKVTFENGVHFDGVLLAVEERQTKVPIIVSTGESNVISGEVYVDGIFKMSKGFKLNGKVSCNRFMMQTKVSLYENFLIDVTINRRARSMYYLSPGILTDQSKTRKVLKWLN